MSQAKLWFPDEGLPEWRHPLRVRGDLEWTVARIRSAPDDVHLAMNALEDGFPWPAVLAALVAVGRQGGVLFDTAMRNQADVVKEWFDGQA